MIDGRIRRRIGWIVEILVTYQRYTVQGATLGLRRVKDFATDSWSSPLLGIGLDLVSHTMNVILVLRHI